MGIMSSSTMAESIDNVQTDNPRNISINVLFRNMEGIMRGSIKKSWYI